MSRFERHLRLHLGLGQLSQEDASECMALILNGLKDVLLENNMVEVGCKSLIILVKVRCVSPCFGMLIHAVFCYLIPYHFRCSSVILTNFMHRRINDSYSGLMASTCSVGNAKFVVFKRHLQTFLESLSSR